MKEKIAKEIKQMILVISKYDCLKIADYVEELCKEAKQEGYYECCDEHSIIYGKDAEKFGNNLIHEEKC